MTRNRGRGLESNCRLLRPYAEQFGYQRATCHDRNFNIRKYKDAFWQPVKFPVNKTFCNTDHLRQTSLSSGYSEQGTHSSEKQQLAAAMKLTQATQASSTGRNRQKVSQKHQLAHELKTQTLNTSSTSIKKQC